MNDNYENKDSKTRPTLELKKTFDAGKIKQSFSHGRSRSVSVEVKKKRFFNNKPLQVEKPKLENIDESEKLLSEKEDDKNYEKNKNDNNLRKNNENNLKENLKSTSESMTLKKSNEQKEFRKKTVKNNEINTLKESDKEKNNKLSNFKHVKVPKKLDERRKGKLTISEALDDVNNEKVRSLAAVKRAREKAKLRLNQQFDVKEQNKIKKKKEVVIPDFIAVNELGSRLAEKNSDIIKVLMKLGVMATINQTIDGDTAELVVIEFGHTPKRVSESDIEIGLSGDSDGEENMTSRPPVVTIMGHVDHGKTSLLDAIRKRKVTQTEAGGITQHIGAYMVNTPKGKITFLDTPGHAAFSQMRARGSNITDLIILVVAADDSVKDQTIEAINHAKAGNCPIIVAVNKVDLPNANPSKVETDLMNYEIISERMGGETLVVEVSAKNNIGLDKLLESIYLQAELLELKANADRKASGTVIESKVETGRGPVISVLVSKGSLKVGDIVLAGKEWGKVRALSDEDGNRLDIALPSYPVEILGLSGAPNSGDEFVVVENESRAREVSQYRGRLSRVRANTLTKRVSVEQMLTNASEELDNEFFILIKADVHGSKEALEQSLLKIDIEKIKIKILHTGVGEINESDVSLASASNAIILGFNVRTNVQARNLAKRDGIKIKYFSIIYEAIDDIKKTIENSMEPEHTEKNIGLVEIKKIFKITKSNIIAGCFVLEGKVTNNCKIRVLRDNVLVHQTSISSLRREQNEVKEVRENFECGVKLLNFNDFKENDKLECFEIIENK